MTVCEMAKQYYPRLWNEDRIRALVEAGRLTQEEAEEIVGHEVNVPTPAADSMMDKLAAAYREGVSEA